jgi:4-hydroxy-3-methylbut-2-enyl diphosphate reductase
MEKRIIKAYPRGFCKGVERGIKMLEDSIRQEKGTVYVRGKIVHNTLLVNRFLSLGAVFTEELDEVPDGSTVVFSTHGVPPSVRYTAAEKNLKIIDATCPLVTKVHEAAAEFKNQGYTIVLIGIPDHPEVIGTAAEAPDNIRVISDERDFDSLGEIDGSRVAWLSQTTLNADETAGTVERLREKFPLLKDPPHSCICYATKERQAAVRSIADKCDLFIAVGSEKSSNTQRLAEVASESGAKQALRVDTPSELNIIDFTSVNIIGITSGVSVTEEQLAGVAEYLGELGYKGARPKIIVISGPNASGKSSLGIELAKIFHGEILSADSRQLYKGFDLCCGKITEGEAGVVPHHLLDIKEIGEPFSVFDYQKMAYSLIPQILTRGNIPFIVGGTGLYVSAVADGYILRGNSADTELRGKLEKLPPDELQAMLTPEAKAFLGPSDLQNKRRIVRVLEKTALGEPLDYNNAPMYDVLRLGVLWSKEKLNQRIDERLARRIELGMIDEVKAYLDGGGDEAHLESLGLEYKYILRYLTGEFKSLEEFKTVMAQKIKQFAKRQMTWFRRDTSIHWIDMETDYLGQARSLISDFLGEPA